jgi:hypothetical protein
MKNSATREPIIIVKAINPRKPGMNKGRHLENKVFGKLKVLKFKGYTKHGKRIWSCECECGRVKNIVGSSLITGKTQTCGGYAHRSTTKPYGEAAFNRLFYIYTKSAKDRDYEFKLTSDEFRYLTKQNCFYCDLPPGSVFKAARMYGPYIYNGIDRKDNLKGYTKENSVPCCGVCNTIKMDLSYEVFLKHIKKIYEVRGLKNDR